MVVFANDGDAISAQKNRIRCFAANYKPASVYSGWYHSDRGRLGAVLCIRFRDGLALSAWRYCVFRRCNVRRIPVRITLGVSRWPARAMGRDCPYLPRKRSWARDSYGYVGGTSRLAANALILGEGSRYGRNVSLEFRDTLLLDI